MRKNRRSLGKRIKVQAKKNSTTQEREALFALIIVWPLALFLVFWLLCKLGILCLFGMGTKPIARKVIQNLKLVGETLHITEGNSVDLSALRDRYYAGDGLELVGGNTFKLAQSGVIPGTYGSSSSVPVVTVDEYGRIIDIHTVGIASFGGIRRINNQTGPEVTIQGTPHQIDVVSGANTITLSTPQDIDIDSSPMFNSLTLTGDLHLGGALYDGNGSSGSSGYVLTSNGSSVQWEDLNALIGDDQTLSWDPATYLLSIENGNSVDLSVLAEDDQTLSWDSSTYLLSIENGNTVDLSTLAEDDQTLSWDDSTFDLTIENGNTVNLSSLAIWKQEPIGGSYSTDLVTPRSSNVQRIYLEHTGWGLTELQIKNEDNSSNYAGAVLSLKGSGPDYTNNMFFAKLGDNYYVPSWAGKGVVSTDQPLVIASVQSNDPAHPNNNPYIMFQTGGHYTSPVDRMILDSNGNLGINDFSPDDKLTVAGNIHLTGSDPGIIHARLIDMLLTTEPSRFGGGDIIIHPGDFGGNSGTPKSVYIYAGRQQVSPWTAYSGNVVMLVPKDSDEIVGHMLVGSKSVHIPGTPVAQFAIPEDSNYDSLLNLVRFSDSADNGAFLDVYRMRGDSTLRGEVQPGDITGGIRSYALLEPSFYNNAAIVFRATSVNHGGGFGGGPGVGGSISLEVSDQSDNHRNALVAFEQGTVGIGVDNFVEDPLSAQLTVAGRNADAAINIMPNGRDPGYLAFTDANAQHALWISIARNLVDDYRLLFPARSGNQYEVLYNDGTGQLLWDTVQHLLSISVGAHAVLYSDGNNIVGDPANFYWDWDNKRLGIGNSSPQAPLEIDKDTGPGLIVRTISSTGHASLIVASPTLPSTSATRIEITHDEIYGTWYGSRYWAIGRDNWGSGTPGIKFNNKAGIWYKLGSGGGSVPQYSLVLTNNNSNRLVILNSGEVGVATYNPSAAFQVGEAGDGTYALANAWNTFSDARFKADIKEIDDALGKIMKLHGVYYRWKIGKDKRRQIGFIAQDVQEVVPELVSSTPEGYLTIDYSKFTPLLVDAIHELDRKAEAAGKDEEVRRIIYGDRTTTGLTQVTKWTKSLFSFLTDVVFKAKATFEGAVTFAKQVMFNDRVEFADKDMGGYAVIKKGDDAVSIIFKKPFAETPVIAVSPFQQVNYKVIDESVKGFTIKLAAAAAEDVKFSWIALNVKDAETVYSSNSTPAPAPTKPITPKPTVSVTPTNTPAPTAVVPSPSPTPLPKGTISPTPTPGPSPTGTGTITPIPTAKPLPTVSIVPKI